MTASSWRCAFRLARRELRGGLRGLRVFLGCIVLGVAAIAGIGSLAASLTAGITGNARELLGGDIEARLAYRPADAAEHAFLAQSGTLSETASLRAMARTPDGGRRSLIELKAVDAGYPLYGRVVLAPPQALAAALGPSKGVFGAVVDRAILDRLGVKLGDTIRIGEAALQLRGTIVREPDAAASGLILGPRVMIAAAALPETKLIQPGALVTYDYRLRFAPGADAVTWASSARAAFPQAGWQIRSFREAARPLQGLIDRIAQFLSLVGLTALLVGGVGIGNAIRGHIAARTATIATLKCLGASTRLVFAVYLIEVMALALLGIGGALGLGALFPIAARPLLAGVLPVSARLGLYPTPLALAALYGLLTTLLFALWPLAGIGRIPAGALFRDVVDRARRRVPPLVLAATTLLALGLAALAVAGAPDRRVALWFIAGAIAAFAIFRAAGAAVVLAAGQLSRAAAPAFALSARQSAPAGRAHGSDRAVARHRADRSDRGGAGGSQPFPRDRNPAARCGARVFLHRHPAGPARRVRGDRARHPRRPPRPGADDARPHHPAERGSGRKDGGDARGAMGIAQRSRADLCRDFAGRLAARRRVLVVARVSWPGAGLVRRGSCARHGAQGRRQPDRQPAWARDHGAYRQSARDRLAAARHQLRSGLCSRHAGARAADPSRGRLSARSQGGSAGAPSDRAVSQRLGDPGPRGACRGRPCRRHDRRRRSG